MKIIEKKIVSGDQEPRITSMVIASPEVAAKAQPGQFVILMVSEQGERIPLTIVDTDARKGTVTIMFQEVGYTTKRLGTLEVGQSLYSFVGPLGNPTPIENYGKVLIVGGGVGIAEVYPVVKALKKAGCSLHTILGARSRDLLVLKDEIKSFSDSFYPVTDDGSFGEKGFVTGPLQRILEKDGDFKLVYCVGPLPMMKAVSELTRPYGIKTIVCLCTIMIDGTGMCGGCRLTEGGKVRFCCVDGPDFDGHLVDFEELLSRQKRFVPQEKQALEKIRPDKNCRCLNKQGN